jgi:hypothetical protein
MACEQGSEAKFGQVQNWQGSMVYARLGLRETGRWKMVYFWLRFVRGNRCVVDSYIRTGQE